MQCANLGPQKVTQATKINSPIEDALMWSFMNLYVTYKWHTCEENNAKAFIIFFFFFDLMLLIYFIKRYQHDALTIWELCKTRTYR